MANLEKKFAKIYDKYVEKIYRFIFLKVDSQESAQDLTGQVFAKVWDKFRKSNGTSDDIKNPVAYLYQVARREIANYHRQKSKFQTISTQNLSLPDPHPSSEQTFTLKEELFEIKNCLAQLNEDYQNVIIWRYLENLSIKEIAKMMEKSKGAVRVMLHRALKELREKMEKL
jgi:RNA polymerase sigma-70 factor (ECF subfamily)